MQFQIRRRILQFLVAFAHRVDVHATVLQRIFERDAILVLAVALDIRVEVHTAARAAAKQAAAKSCALFIGPINQPHRDRWLALILIVNPAQHFNAGEHIQNPSSQPPLGTLSMCPPISNSCLLLPFSVAQVLPASSLCTFTGS